MIVSPILFWNKKKYNKRNINLLGCKRIDDLQYFLRSFFSRRNRIYFFILSFFHQKNIYYTNHSFVFLVSVQTVIKMMASIVLILVIYFWADWKIESVFFLSFLLVIFIFHWGSRVVFLGAMVCLIFVPILLVLNNKVLAEVLAIDTYYFLLLGTVLEMKRMFNPANIYIKIRVKFRFILNRYGVHPFIFLLLVFFVVVPLFFKSGFIFLLDWVPVPNTAFFYDWKHPSFIFNFLLWFLDLFFPDGFLQKFFLFFTLFFAGFGIFRLLQLNILKIIDERRLWSAYFGGIFYIFNPFVYSRIITGQWQIIIAYAIVPWLLSFFLRFLDSPSFINSILVVLWLTAVVVIDIHSGLLMVLLLFFIGFYSLFNAWRKNISLLKGYSFIAASFFIFNIYWIIPAIVTKTSQLGSFVSSIITNTDIFSFFTRPDPQHGILWNTAAMYGFWGDEESRYISMKLFVPYWFYLFLFILALVILGVIVSLWKGWKQYRISKKSGNLLLIYQKQGLPLSISLALVSTALVVFFFSVGVSYPFFQDKILWLYEYIPFLRGLREPHKAVALLVFVYAIFSSIGVSFILEAVERLRSRFWLRAKLFIPGLLLIIPLAYSPGMLWGFHGQIKPSNYPESWFAAGQYLQEDNGDFRVLFFPWHLYLSLSFVDNNIIANPAERFFHKPTIAGDNMEFGPIYSQSTRPESKYIEEEILKQRAALLNAGEKLAKINVKYVILVEESDFLNYAFLDNQKDLEVVFQDEKIKIYLNKSWIP